MALSKVQGSQIETPVDIASVNLTGVSTAAQLNVGTGGTIVTTTTGGSIGVGTTNPSRIFQVFNSTNAVISAKNDSIEGVLNATSNNVNVGSASNDFLTVSVNNDEKARFQTDGNIGIGTTNAGDKVVIQQNTDDNIILRINGKDHVTEFAGLGVGQGYASFVAGGSTTTNTDMILFSTSAGVESEGARLTSAGILSCKLGNNTYGKSTSYALHLGKNSDNAAGAIRLDSGFDASNGCHGLIQATTENFHIDSVGTALTTADVGLHLNWYDGDYIDFGNGAAASAGRFTSSGLLYVNASSGANTDTKLLVNGGNIQVSSGYGIDFSATTDGSGTTTSEILDDYEEGTWTPEVKINGSTAGITYSARNGYYTRVGRLVHIWGNFILTNKGSSTGNVTISGQPFDAADTGSQRHPVYATVFWNKAVSTSFNIIQVSNHMQFRSTASTTDTQMSNADINNNTGLSFGGVMHL